MDKNIVIGSGYNGSFEPDTHRSWDETFKNKD